MSRAKRYFVSASEVAAYIYCAESWRLRHGLGLGGHGQGRLRQGEVEHAHWQDIERSTRRRRRLVLPDKLVSSYSICSVKKRGCQLLCGWDDVAGGQ